jgi:hypothetical protein
MSRLAAGLVFLGACSEYTVKEIIDPPVISVDPTAIDFGVIGMGEVAERPFTVTNLGEAPLELGTLTIDPGFELGTDPSGVTLAEGEVAEGTVRYTSVFGPPLYGRVLLPSNDEVTPEAQIDLRGIPGLPELQITPNPVEFGTVEVNEEATVEVTMTNVGSEPLDVLDARVSDPFFMGQLNPITIPPGDSRSVIIHFSPPEPIEYTELLVFDVAGIGEAPVELHGFGNSTPTALCEADPVNPIIPRENTRLIGSGSTDPAGRPLDYEWILLDQPNRSSAVIRQERQAEANIDPDELGRYKAKLTVTNDLGASDSCTVEFEAVGDKPEAQCSANPNPAEALRDQVTFSGRGSTDPGGTALTYRWTLRSQPAGSSATMPNGRASDSDRTGFVADQAGTYVARLVVTNTSGVESDPCDVTLDVVPGEDLWVEMFWSQSGEDMDLHLVRETGNLNTNQDCYYGNCIRGGLNWGPAGVDGNPSLDLDDVPGRGPENINISTPEDVIYHVWVHDFPSSRRTSATDVTVNVYLGGILAFTDTRAISGEDDEVEFAEIDWANATVTRVP